MNKITVIMHGESGQQVDIEIPTDVSAEALLEALNHAFRSGKQPAAAIRSINPLSYLSGNTRVEDARLHNGTELFFVED